jgi:alkanesulfonate monooxygenase SsuD/methylene tetrahydromethanopterin reductase-like flavin-dependent oxidoreductase (luciferase family)
VTTRAFVGLGAMGRPMARRLLGAPGTIDPERDPFLRGETDALPTALTDRCLIGTPEQVRDQMNGYRAAGVDMFGCWFLDFPDPTSAVLFSELTGMSTAAKS